MRTSILAVVALTSAGLMAGCAQQAAAPAVDTAAEAAAITARSAEWNQLYVSRDADAIVNNIFTAEIATMFDGKVTHGREAALATMHAELTAMPDSTISWTTNHVHVAASGDLAYELGSFTFDPDGAGEIPAANGEYLTVWTKADGSWRATADAGTEIKPAATPAG